jgi:hypothetical protein
MTRQPRIEFYDPAELTIHPGAKKLPGWSKDDERFIALVEDIRERGIDQPLQIDAEKRVLEGRERLKAARQLQLKEVPVIVREPGEEVAVILHSLLQRKHYTKGQLAYVAFPLLEPAIQESRKRRLENLKNAKTPINSRKGTECTIEIMAADLGISRKLLVMAGQLHRLFSESDHAIEEWDAAHPHGGEGRPEDLRARFEPQILTPVEGGERGQHICGLGDVLAGIGGQKSTKGQQVEKPRQLELFEDAWSDLRKRALYWDSFDERTKLQARDTIYAVVAEMPDEVADVLAKAVAKRLNQRARS